MASSPSGTVRLSTTSTVMHWQPAQCEVWLYGGWNLRNFAARIGDTWDSGGKKDACVFLGPSRYVCSTRSELQFTGAGKALLCILCSRHLWRGRGQDRRAVTLETIVLRLFGLLSRELYYHESYSILSSITFFGYAFYLLPFSLCPGVSCNNATPSCTWWLSDFFFSFGLWCHWIARLASLVWKF